MKTRFLILSAVVASLSLTGCAFMNDEDREFYGKGWVHPTELDEVAPRHDPLATNPQVAAQPSAGTSAQQPAPEWIVPETSNDDSLRPGL